MSLYDTLAGQLANEDQRLLVGPPFRQSAVVAPVLSPSSRLTLMPAVAGQLPLEIDSALLIESIWAILTPTAAQNLVGMTLAIANNVTAFQWPVGMPISTITTGLTGAVSLFFPAIGLLTMRDYVTFNSQFGGASLVGSALQLLLSVTTSASTMAINWGCRYRVVRSLNEG